MTQRNSNVTYTALVPKVKFVYLLCILVSSYVNVVYMLHSHRRTVTSKFMCCTIGLKLSPHLQACAGIGHGLLLYTSFPIHYYSHPFLGYQNLFVTQTARESITKQTLDLCYFPVLHVAEFLCVPTL
jgi:hypothetical protein